MSAQAKALVCLFAGAVAIGAAPICVRLADLTPEAVAFWRLCLALPLLLPCWWFLGNRLAPIRRREQGLLLIAGLAFAADLAVWHYAVNFTSVANATLLPNLAPVLVAIAAVLWLGERLNGAYVFGLCCALVGAAVLVQASAQLDGAQVLGDVLGVLTAVFYAVYLVTVAMLRRQLDTWTIMLASTAIAALVLGPIAAARGPILPPTAEDWGVLIFLAVVSHVGGQGLIAYALAHLPASFSSAGLLLQPVAAAAFAWLILAEALSAAQVLGGGVVLAGIWTCRRATRAIVKT